MTGLLPKGAKAAEQHEALSRDFFASLLWLFGLYTFALGVVHQGRLAPSTTALVSVPLQIAFAAAAARFVRKSGWGLAAFGVTTRGAARAALLGALQAALASPLVLGGKAALQAFGLVAAGPLFGLPSLVERHGGAALSAQVAVYVLFVAVQELVARGVVQTGLTVFLPGPRWHATLLSSAIFALTHLHVSLPVTVASFGVSLWWGGLFARQRTLSGVVVCHALLGAFGYFVVGVDGR